MPDCEKKYICLPLHYEVLCFSEIIDVYLVLILVSCLYLSSWLFSNAFCKG